MYVMVMVLECRLPYVHSLKGKRVIRTRLVERLKRDFQVSASEVATQDRHQELTVGMSAVSSDATYLRNLPDKIRNAAEGVLEGFVVQSSWDVVPWP
ncbi:MAG TPA: DUF503 domain-containing protein [Thermoanaerobaculia bacterium]|nr:DUF503 domain-containing protein [Thermoanaerobaculia bacterium]HUM29565.1 DUF503 domain-containing protein [Thermoanaerobaculia bacterium]HXK67948.1 DUF503 domain-containing protein [Thermoanaerobaculia bacterium]